MKEKKQKFELNETTQLILKCAGALLFPVFLVLFYCLIRGIRISDIYAPASINNDCLFYYKLVEGVRYGGIPRGYFGFNESRAMVGSFAAWSPVMLLPWVLWSIPFGWSYASAFISNVVIFSIALSLFVFLTDIDWKNELILFGMFLLYPSLPIHLTNCLPEVPIASIALIFLGLCIKNIKIERDINLVFMLILSFILTLIRPYMFLLMIIPFYFLIKKDAKKGLFQVAILSVISLASYFLVSYFFTAEYFTPLFDLSSARMIIEGRFVEFFWTNVYTVRSMKDGLLEVLRGAFTFGQTSGIQYVMFIVLFLFTAIKIFDKEEKDARPVSIIMTITYLILSLAIIFLLQKVNEGARHVWVFTIIGCALLAVYEFNIPNNIMKGLVAILFLIFIFKGSLVPTDYDVPVKTNECEEAVNFWSETAEKIEVKNELDFDNTIIWVFIDYRDDKQEVTPFSGLFAMPKKMGISCCYPDYVLDNFSTLKSKYIFTLTDGKVAAKCEEENYELVASFNNASLYKK